MLSRSSSRITDFRSLSLYANGPLRFVSSNLAKPASSIKNTAIGTSLLAIVKADIALEFWQLKTINRINNYTYRIQHRLFLASMWLDKRRYG